MSNVYHEGIVEGIKNDKLQIKIVQHSACGSCELSNKCNISEQKEKIIELPKKGNNLKIADRVTIETSTSTGLLAVLYAFTFPLLLMLFAIVCGLVLFKSEPLAALLCLVTLSAYYVVLYIFRKKTTAKFSFKIKNIG